MRLSFTNLPNDARVWVFASDRPLATGAFATLNAEVDRFLDGWQAHGHPLSCARDWRDERFLAIGVDQSTAGASGCSIDGLFRSLRALEPRIGASLLSGARVFYRDTAGTVRAVTREEFATLAAAGSIARDTTVFDTTVTTADAWRREFEKEVGRSWHKELAPEVVQG